MIQSAPSRVQSPAGTANGQALRARRSNHHLDLRQRLGYARRCNGRILPWDEKDPFAPEVQVGGTDWDSSDRSGAARSCHRVVIVRGRLALPQSAEPQFRFDGGKRCTLFYIVGTCRPSARARNLTIQL